MPARRNRTAEEIREQTRLRVQRYRERRNATVTLRGNATGPREAPAGNVTPSPPTPPPSPSISKEIEKIGRLLAPFASRGYAHDPDFWAEMAASYPAVRLVVEAYNLASWLKTPLKRNRTAECSQKFIINWLKKAQRDAEAPPPPPNGTAPTRPVPPGGDRNPGPAPVLPVGVTMERIDPAVAARHLLDAKRLTLPEKLAAARNGRHG